LLDNVDTKYPLIGDVISSPLNETAYLVYGWVLDHGQADYRQMATDLGVGTGELRACVETLTHWRLLRELPNGSTIVADRPDAALAETMLPLEAAITGFQLAVDRMRNEFDTLLTTYPVASDQGMTEPLDGDLDVALRALLETRPRDLLIANPGKSPISVELRQALWGGSPPLPGTAKVHVLYQHSSRFDATTRSHAESARAAGAQIRTVGELKDRMVVFDRKTALLPGEEGALGVLVREPTVVDFLARMFDRSWRAGLDFVGESGWRYDAQKLVGTVRQDIIRLLMDGARDETIAQRLDMSVRTCRRHIATIMEGLGAESRFQAGYLLRENGYTG